MPAYTILRAIQKVRGENEDEGLGLFLPDHFDEEDVADETDLFAWLDEVTEDKCSVAGGRGILEKFNKDVKVQVDD